MSKKADHSTDIAQAIASKIQDQVGTLFGRTWPEINDILGKEQKIILVFKVDITDRRSAAGEHADKDSRIKTTISFSEKYSDTIESDIPDPAQQHLL